MNTLGGETIMAWLGGLVSSCKCYLNIIGVADEDRTRNPQSGNLMLHHLSYSDIKKGAFRRLLGF